MGLITRCPACQTSFRVVPDQLRMSEGWARCGQCSEIFDAASSLQDDSQSVGPGVQIDVDVYFDPDATDQPTTNQFAIHVPAARTTTAALNVGTREELALKTALQEIVAARSGAVDAVESGVSSALSGTRQAGDARGASSSSQQEAVKQPSVSFLREVSRRSAWHAPWARASLSVVGMGLLGVLVIQIVVHERDRVATLFPQAKPALEAACSYLNCRVSTLQQIDSVVVESSTFSKIRNDTYRLSLAIKNTAPYELAMPALELTLTDAQDQALLRRVLLGAEVNVNNKLGANSEWVGSIDVSVRSANAADRVAGYRVLAFYP